MTTIKQTIPPFLWFENQAGLAMSFYLSVFKNLRAKSWRVQRQVTANV